MQQGGERQKFGDPGPQFDLDFGSRLGQRRIVWNYAFRPRNGEFAARAIGQLDQVARLRVGRVPGAPQYFNNLVVQRMMGMRHTHQLAIV